LKNLSPAAIAFLSQSILTLAWCWKLTRRDGQVQGFTTFNKPLIVNGLLYRSDVGFNPSAIEQTHDVAINNLSIKSALKNDAISEKDLVGGRYDGAKVELFWVDWTNPATQIPVLAGYLGEVANDGEQYSAEFRALAQVLAQKRLQQTSKTCRYQFGDSRCKKTVTTIAATVLSVTADNHGFTIASGQPNDLFAIGAANWTTGENAGLGSSIAESTANGSIKLFESPPYPIRVGDTLNLSAGCRYTRRHCEEIHNNLVNFGGEPELKDSDFLVKSP